ncbi:MAG: RICIN domain-containing protein [Ruminococcus sp.]|nr:RICIN domain-containing protein [Ruminococcus sp.]
MRSGKIISAVTSAALAFSGLVFPSSVPVTAGAAQANWKFDLGGNGAAGGFTGVSAYDGYDASRGYGFANTGGVQNVSSSGQGANSDAVKFNSTDGRNTFNVDLPKGLYRVTVTTGDTFRTSIRMEGMLQMINLTGNNAVETIELPVTDGQLNIQAGPGKDNTNFSISAIEITQLNDTGVTNPTVWICGDSTVANYYNCADTSQHGWGQYFGGQISDSGYIVRNMAASGQYAKGFVDAGQFDCIETYGKSGDYYIISIGINDTNYSNKDEYYATVTDMVKRSKAKGMEVVLVKQQGRRGDLTRSPKLGGRWFSDKLDQIGSEQSVQVVDLFNAWQDFGFSVGYDGMESYYAAGDDLHQSKMGAQKLAELMADLVTIGTPREPAEMDTSKAYRIKNVNSGLYMSVKNNEAAAGANIEQSSGDISDGSVWRLKHKGYNYYELWTYLEGGDTYVADVDGGKADSGANLALYTNNNNGAQWFRFFENEGGSYTIVSRCSGDKGAIEVTNALTTDGANIQQWEINGHDCQKWVLEAVEWPVQQATAAPTDPPTEVQPATQYVPADAGKYMKGDANCDQKINVADAVAVLQYIANQSKYPLDEYGSWNADVDGSSGITGGDAIFIQRIDAGLETPPQDTPPVQAATEPPVTEPPVTEPSAPEAVRYFAADQIWDQGIVETVNAGYTRSDGYVNLDNTAGSSITFSVTVPEEGKYMTHIRFANGSTSDRKMKITVSGNDSVWMQSFPGTGAWTEWKEYGIVLPMKAGDNTIKFESAMSEGGPNFDYIELILTDEPVAEVYDPNQGQQQYSSDKPTIFLAGDSTCMYYDARKKEQSGAEIQGWGAYLQNYFTDNVSVSNHAMAGRSSKKFYDEGRWQTILDNIKQGDYVMIQFAINDAGATNADRYAPICGNVDNPSSGSYEWYMTEFINSAKSKGANPVLVTCTLRFKDYANGKFVPGYDNYNNACKQLAQKNNIPCIDLNTIMVNYYNSISYQTVQSYHMPDGTHFTEQGADMVAGLVSKEVANQNITGLASFVK